MQEGKTLVIGDDILTETQNYFPEAWHVVCIPGMTAHQLATAEKNLQYHCGTGAFTTIFVCFSQDDEFTSVEELLANKRALILQSQAERWTYCYFVGINTGRHTTDAVSLRLNVCDDGQFSAQSKLTFTGVLQSIRGSLEFQA